MTAAPVPPHASEPVSSNRRGKGGCRGPGEGGAWTYYREEEEEEGREREGRREQVRAVIPLRRRGDAEEVDGADIYRGISQPGTLISVAKRAHTHIAGVVSGLRRSGSAETC